MNAEVNTSYTVTRALKLMMPPTIFSALVMALLDLAEVMIMTNIYGTNGLVIASVFLPVICFSYSIFSGIGYGGSNLFAYYIGRKDYDEAQKVFSGVAFIGLAVAVTGTIVGLFFLDLITNILLGSEIAGNPANALLVNGVRNYGAWIMLSLPIAAVKLILTYFVRVDNNPNLAMYTHIWQAMINIIFDLVFMGMLNWGPQGAAIAMALAVTVAFGVLLTHFKKPCAAFTFSVSIPGWKRFARIMQYSLSFIGDNMYNPLVMLILNGIVLRQFGVNEASIFFVVTYCYFFMDILGDGLKESLSPLQGIFYGERNNRAIMMTTFRGLSIGVIAGVGLMSGLLICPAVVPWMYGFENPELMEKCNFAVQMFAVAIPFAMLNIIMASAYQAVDRRFNTFIITFMRGFAILLAMGCFALSIKSELLFRQMFINTEIIVMVIWILLAMLIKKRHNKESLLLLSKEKPDYRGHLYLMLAFGTTQLLEYQKDLAGFLRAHDIEEKKAGYAVLGLEEIMLYAIGREGYKKSNFIDLQVMVHKDRQVRFIAKFESKAEDLMATLRSLQGEMDDDYIGMRLLYKISRRFDYTCMMGFNCLDIVF